MLTAPQAQPLRLPFHRHPERHIDRFRLHRAVLARCAAQRIKGQDRIDRGEWSRWPGTPLVQDGIRHIRDARRRHLDAIHLLQMGLHLTGGQATGLQREHCGIAARQPALTLFPQLRLETAVAVTGHCKGELPRLRLHSLLALAMTAMVPIAILAHLRGVASVRGELCREGALDHPFRQLLQQAMRSQDILGVDIIFQSFVS